MYLCIVSMVDFCISMGSIPGEGLHLGWSGALSERQAGAGGAGGATKKAG